VYIAARAPDAGEDHPALAARFPTPPANAGLVKSGTFEQLSQDAFLTDFAGGVPRSRALGLYAAQGPISTSLFSDRTTVAAWRNKPTWYAVSTQDRTASPELERFLANRMKATTVELNTSHLSIVTQPDAVTKPRREPPSAQIRARRAVIYRGSSEQRQAVRDRCRSAPTTQRVFRLTERQRHLSRRAQVPTTPTYQVAGCGRSHFEWSY
jgi:hypothetical protein